MVIVANPYKDFYRKKTFRQTIGSPHIQKLSLWLRHYSWIGCWQHDSSKHLSFIELKSTKRSHHVSAVEIFVSRPVLFIWWIRQLKDCSPFITVYVSLSCYSTHLNCGSHINLQPVSGAIIHHCAPSITSCTVKSTISWSTTFSILWRSCHPIVRNYAWIRHSYRNHRTVFHWPCKHKYIMRSTRKIQMKQTEKKSKTKTNLSGAIGFPCSH